MSSLGSDGLAIRATGYEVDGAHWTGLRHVPSGDAGFPFWRWFHLNRAVLPPILDERLVPALVEFVSTLGPETRLQAPLDGVYLCGVSSGRQASGSLQPVFEVLKDSSVHWVPAPFLSPDLNQLLQIVSKGALEVFVYRAGCCTFSTGFEVGEEVSTMAIRLLAKHATAVGNPSETPGQT
jgi:hypothetical protein